MHRENNINLTRGVSFHCYFCNSYEANLKLDQDYHGLFSVQLSKATYDVKVSEIVLRSQARMKPNIFNSHSPF